MTEFHLYVLLWLKVNEELSKLNNWNEEKEVAIR